MVYDSCFHVIGLVVLMRMFWLVFLFYSIYTYYKKKLFCFEEFLSTFLCVCPLWSSEYSFGVLKEGGQNWSGLHETPSLSCYFSYTGWLEELMCKGQGFETCISYVPGLGVS